MFCIARKLEDLKENRYAAPIPGHTQGSSKMWARLQAEPSPALPAPLGARGQAALTGWCEDFSLLFKWSSVLSIVSKPEIIPIETKGTRREMGKSVQENLII